MAKKIPAAIRKNPRYVAMLTLGKVEKQGAYSNLLLNEMIHKSKLSEADVRLYTELVYGTLSRQLLLDYYLQAFLAKAKKVDPWVRQLLRLSVYQLAFLDRVPDHAVLNDAVEIAKVYGNEGAGKFVNGVLRNVQRQGLPDLAEISDPLERLAVEISLPKWLTEKLVQQIGLDETRKLGLSLFEASFVSGRVDTRIITREEALEAIQAEGIDVVASPISPVGIVAEKGYLAGTDLFKAGLLTLQDESSMLVAPTLAVAEDHKILDACAAPGGKTTHLATYLNASAGGEVIALDIHQHKLKLIEENAQRLRVADAVVPTLLDARAVATNFPPETFDGILVDAPCSGLGLMRRKPDIKYHKRPEDFLQLQNIQLDILESVAPTLKKGGRLTYSTCTIAEEENQQVIEKFLHKHPEFEIINLTVNEQVATAITNGMLMIYPHTFMTDGFFICCLQKKA